MSNPKRLLIVASTTGYQTRVFAEAAQRLGVQATLATDRCHILDDPWHDHAIPVRFDKFAYSARQIGKQGPFDAIVAVGDRPAHLAALYAEHAGIPFHPANAVAAARNKFEARERFRSAGLPVPAYRKIPIEDDSPRDIDYPCVLKPLGLSASRGVIRANNPAEFSAAFRRIRAILASREIARHRDEADRFILVERFIPGREYALEGIVTGGRLHVLAIFDKPDPLDGPFFEETLYVTPSSGPSGAIVEAARQAVAALGLAHGPIHAEMRCNGEGVWMLEAAARPIGGLCARALRFEPDWPLEELVLRHALGEDVTTVQPAPGASGVMMIPIPREGIYRGVSGLAEGDDIVITAKEGQHFVPLPEGHSYLGFIFARGESAREVDSSLRATHARLAFDLAGVLPALA